MIPRKRLLIMGQTTVYLHIATVFFALYMILLGHERALAMSMASVLLHEGAHATMAYAFGKPPQEIEITPLGALMHLEDEAELTPGKRMVMLAAGPLASLLLCWGALALTRQGWLDTGVGRSLFCCNLLLALGNLLPVLPLDGGRMLALVLSLRLRSETMRRIMRISGTVIGLCCIVLNIVLSLHNGGWNLSCAIAGCFFVYSAAVSTTSYAMAELRRFLDKKSRLDAKKIFPCRYFATTPYTTLRQAICNTPPNAYTMLCVIDPVDMRLLAQVSEGELLAAYLNTPGETCAALLSN